MATLSTPTAQPKSCGRLSAHMPAKCPLIPSAPQDPLPRRRLLDPRLPLPAVLCPLLRPRVPLMRARVPRA